MRARRASKEFLASAIKPLAAAVEQKVEREADLIPDEFQAELIRRAYEFVMSYTGESPRVRSIRRRLRTREGGMPTLYEAFQVNRVAHQEHRATLSVEDSLGRRIKDREGNDLPDSLAYPDWLDEEQQ